MRQRGPTSDVTSNGPAAAFRTLAGALLALSLSLGAASMAAAAPTTLSGQVKTTQNVPLANVVIKDGTASALTGADGRFTLTGLPSGPSAMVIDGRKAGQSGNQDYGYFEAQITTIEGQANVLPFTSYLPRIDHAHDVTIPSPTTSAVVISTPQVPGLELHIPAGMVITDPDGKVVTKVGITRIPLDRTPFPLPQNVDVPIFFTAQPGGSAITTVGGQRGYAQVYYPNSLKELPGARATFWRYDPDELGWTPYGLGVVNAAATQVVPFADTRIYEFTGAMFNGAGGQPNAAGPNPSGNGLPGLPGAGGSGGPPSAGPGGAPGQPGGPGDPGSNPRGGEPVDLATGLFVLTQSDLYVDDVIPLQVVRTYRQNDTNRRNFGVGTTLSYDLYLWSANEYQEVDLLMPDGGKVHYTRISPGTGFVDAVFATNAAPNPFYQSRIAWNGNGWNLTLQDGTIYVFGNEAPLQSIQDRFGNVVQLTRANGAGGDITQVTSPNGKFIKFTYDSSDRITSAKDNLGRTVSYVYDSSGRLSTITDPNNGVTTYTWDSSNRISTIVNQLQATVLTNTYDANGRVDTQTLADGGVTHFAYTLDGSGQVLETDVTDPRGAVRKVNFTGQYWVRDRLAVGTPYEEEFDLSRDPSNQYPVTHTDPLGRQTTWTYDANGNTLSVTRLAGTADAVTSGFTYSPAYNQLLTTTDPLGHTTTFQRGSLGELSAIIDPLNHSTTFGYDVEGNVTSITDALSNVTHMTYDHGDLASITDPLNRTVSRYTDGAGRVIRITDPVGAVATIVQDPIFGVHQVTDATGAVTTSNYNAAGYLANVVDPRSGTTVYTYDTKNRLTARRDPLLASDTFTSYDANDNLLAATDRKGQAVSYTYDPLNRLASATYADGAVVTYTWDLGNRLTQVQDSAGGTVTRTYDGLDRLMTETTPQGAVTYAYDNASRRIRMSTAGQPDVTYDYDNADRLLHVIQGVSTVTLGYDDANRRTSLTLPSGLVAAYAYDAASALTGVTYTQGLTAVGALAYAYGGAGRVANRSGALFQSVLPAPVTSATYDADNRLTNWTTGGGSVNPTYDANGSLLSAGSQTFSWDARNRLTAVTGAPASFVYDPFGRRSSATLGGTTTSYLYDGANVILELSGGSPSASLLTGLALDQRFTRTAGATTSNFVTDNLGSTAALTDSSGTIQASYGYDPYGVTSATGGGANSYQYTGRENDGATGLYFNRARYYNPAWGRFISEDPAGLTADYNLYRYAGDDPLDQADVLGLDPNGSQTTCVVKGKTTGNTNTRGGALPGVHPAPGNVAIAPRVLGLHEGASTNRILAKYASQIQITFSPPPRLPAGFPTQFTVGDVVGPAWARAEDPPIFDINGLPNLPSTYQTTGVRNVTMTYPTSAPFTCGGALK